MKINLPDYNDIHLDQDVWKTLVIIFTIQQEMKTVKITPEFVMAMRILEIPYPLTNMSQIDIDSIKMVEKITNDHIEILRSNNLIDADKFISVPSKHESLLNYLRHSIHPTIPLPQNWFMIFERILPQGRSKNGTFSNEDDSFTMLSRGFGFLTRGIFIKIWIGNFVFSGLIQFDEELPKVFEYLSGIRNELSRVGIKISVLEKTPIKPISLFPLFTTGSKIYGTLNKNKTNTQPQIDDMEVYLRGWFTEYLESYHEITKLVPRISLVDPHHEKTRRIVVLASKKQDVISTITLLSDDGDKIDVHVLEKVPLLDQMSSSEYVPQNSHVLHAQEMWSSNVIRTLGHPYLKAMKDIAKRIEEFNKLARNPLFDSNDISETEIIDSVSKEISTIRYLVKRLDIDDPNWKEWLNPISVLIDYELDEPKPHWRRSGHLMICYMKSESDKIEIHKMDHAKIMQEFVSEKDSESKYILISNGDLLHHMMEVRGEHSRIYF